MNWPTLLGEGSFLIPKQRTAWTDHQRIRDLERLEIATQTKLQLLLKEPATNKEEILQEEATLETIYAELRALRLKHFIA